jgi:hypothetical protein
MNTMPVDVYAVAMWLSLAFAEPMPPAPAPNPELLEFLGSFETKTGQWPELNEALAKPPTVKAAAPPALPPKSGGEPE